MLQYSMKRITAWIAFLASLYFCIVQANLFEGKQNIVSLDRYSFHSSITNQNEYILCNFYLDSCGSCQRFSFILKQFANEIRLWRRVVRIVTIDCENEKQFCSRLGITRYPSTFLIPPNSKEPIKEWEKIEANFSVTIDVLYEAVLKRLTSERHIRYQPLYAYMPLFSHNKQDVCNLFDLNDQRDMYVIVDHHNSKSTFGTKVILDMFYYHKFVEGRYVIGNENLFSSLLPYQVHIPAILKVDVRQCTFSPTITSAEPKVIRLKFIQHLEEQYPDVDVPQDDQDPIKTYDNMVKQPLTFTDLNNALRVVVLEEIPARKTFDQKEVDVLKQFFAVVLHYFPFNNENVRRLFKRLNNWLVQKDGGLSSVSYREAVRISDGFLPPIQSWEHCKGSAPQYRGYPCGLWVMFHLMTVHEYHLNRRNKHHVHQVLPVMRNFISTFYSCDECQHHFHQMSEHMQEQLIYPNSSVLWLWRAHNNVNKRLQNQMGEDPAFPKEIFPTLQQCTKCFEPNGRYNEHRVLEFLSEYYNKTTISKNSFLKLEFNVWLLICILIAGHFQIIIEMPNRL